MKNHFQPAWWLPGGHLQTLWAALVRRTIDLSPIRERLWLPDGDFLDLDWTPGNPEAPVVLVLHGLEGSIESNYAKGMLRALQQAGLRGVLMHFRGCSGEHNKRVRAYHVGETGDLAYVLQTLHLREPSAPVAVIGFSLGGNVILKYLGETGSDNPISCAVAVSVPFLPDRFADKVLKGTSSIYQKYLLSKLRTKILDKAGGMEFPIDVTKLKKIKNFWDFDSEFTAKVYGFKDVKDYYERSSSLRYLSLIEKKTLIIHARNDPFLYPDAIPDPGQLPDDVELELFESGGHLGFIGGCFPWKPKYWLEERIPSYIQENGLGPSLPGRNQKS